MVRWASSRFQGRPSTRSVPLETIRLTAWAGLRSTSVTRSAASASTGSGREITPSKGLVRLGDHSVNSPLSGTAMLAPAGVGRLAAARLTRFSAARSSRPVSSSQGSWAWNGRATTSASARAASRNVSG